MNDISKKIEKRKQNTDPNTDPLLSFSVRISEIKLLVIDVID